MKLFVSCLNISIFLTVLVGLMVPAISFCEDLYVDCYSGRDTGRASSQTPWKTIGAALKHARNSDVIYIEPGTYHESLNLAMIPLRGVSLVGISDNGNRPVIQSESPDTDTIFLVNYYGVVKNLDITGAANSHGINCIANGGRNQAEISRCNIYGNNVGVHVTTVGNSSSECIPFIHDNKIFSNVTQGIGNMGHSSALIQRNIINDNGSGEAGNGGIGNRDNSSAQIIGNIIYANNHSGIAVRDHASPKIVNNTIYNHSFSGNQAAGIRFANPPNNDPTSIINNIIAQNTFGLLTKPGSSLPVIDYNLVWNNSAADYKGFQKGEHGISADPLMLNPENGDFHLTADSPCIDAGLTSDLSKYPDFDGIQRPVGASTDIGAYEYIDESESPLRPTPPVIAAEVNGQNINITWNQVPWANRYILFYAPEDISYINTINLENRKEFSTKLWDGAAFFVAVKACNNAGCSDFSDIKYLEIN